MLSNELRERWQAHQRLAREYRDGVRPVITREVAVFLSWEAENLRHEYHDRMMAMHAPVRAA